MSGFGTKAVRACVFAHADACRSRKNIGLASLQRPGRRSDTLSTPSPAQAKLHEPEAAHYPRISGVGAAHNTWRRLPFSITTKAKVPHNKSKSTARLSRDHTSSLRELSSFKNSTSFAFSSRKSQDATSCVVRGRPCPSISTRGGMGMDRSIRCC